MNPDDIQKAISSALTLEEYPENIQDQIVEELATIIMKRALVELTASLPEEKRDEFLTLVEAGNTKDLGPFVEANIPAFETIVRESVDTEVKDFLKAQEKNFAE